MIKGIILIGSLLFLVSLCANPETETKQTAKSKQGQPESTLKKPQWDPHPYRMVETKDISWGSRKRVQVWISAPLALTQEHRIATAQRAAVREHRKTWPDYVGVFLMPSEKTETVFLATLDYAPDGCGLSGDDCTDEIWTNIKATDQSLTPEQLMIWEAWMQHKDEFRDKKDQIINEDRLKEFLSSKFDMGVEEIDKHAMATIMVSMSLQSVELPWAQQQIGTLTDAEKKVAKEKACRNDLQCWGDRTTIDAAIFCQDHIERMAQYAHEWTDGWLEPKFSRFKWKDRKAGTITYMGDKMRFQNGFGAWQNIVYECDFRKDARFESGHVLAARARPGRLQ